MGCHAIANFVFAWNALIGISLATGMDYEVMSVYLEIPSSMSRIPNARGSCAKEKEATIGCQVHIPHFTFIVPTTTGMPSQRKGGTKIQLINNYSGLFLTFPS